jgi:hypothetical protein
VKQALRCGAISVVVAIELSTGSARATPARVYLHDSGREQPSRVLEELRSDGYEVRSVASDASPCETEPAAPAMPAPIASRPTAWIAIELDEASGELVATICYVAPRAAPERTVLRVPADDPRRFALATVEALNGLAARPRPREEAEAAPAPPPERARARGARASALSVNAALEVDTAGGRPLVGTLVGLDTALGPGLSLSLEIFGSVQETTARGRDRELSLGAAWARLGPRMTWVASPLRLGLSLQAGAALVWASAETTPPLIGTAEQTAAALLATGFSLECPADTLVYLRAAGGATRLVPSVDLVLGDGSSRSFGELLIEMNIGVGVRWDTAH